MARSTWPAEARLRAELSLSDGDTEARRSKTRMVPMLLLYSYILTRDCSDFGLKSAPRRPTERELLDATHRTRKAISTTPLLIRKA